MNESGGGDEKKNSGGGHRKQPQISRSSFSNLPPRRGVITPQIFSGIFKGPSSSSSNSTSKNK
ncbi:hypothetical protein CsSME_00003011 [Camellia sinensis var. sinensis]|uniref:Uncharacterized protein n=1 Tax=Camellia sinensis TaxID=4442 RepID=A0A7J7I6N4_CAMSI|nr:hypothetical protein HYC85_001892 [Camellia sinensis]